MANSAGRGPTKYERETAQGTVAHLAGMSRIADVAFNTGGTAAVSAALNAGIYDVWTTQDCYIAVGATNAVTCNSTTGYLVRASDTIPIFVPDQYFIGIVAATTNGTFSGFQLG